MRSSTQRVLSHADRYERSIRMANEVRLGKTIPEVARAFRVNIETVRRACKQHNPDDAARPVRQFA
jgi:transposase